MGAGPELPQSECHERGLLINYGAKSLERTRFIRPTTVRKETETKNLRNLRIFPNSLPFNDCSSFSWSTH
jgi:hypothetical protein